MKPRADNYLSLNQAILAADVPYKHVRNWIDRHEVTFDADATRREGHRRYSELDCVRMALISRLKRFGFEGKEASGEVEAVIRGICQDWKIQYGKRDNITIVDALRKLVVIFYLIPDRDESGFGPTPTGKRIYDHARLIKRKVKSLAKLYEPMTDIPAEADMRLVVDVGAIVDGIYQRLEKILKD